MELAKRPSTMDEKTKQSLVLPPSDHKAPVVINTRLRIGLKQRKKLKSLLQLSAALLKDDTESKGLFMVL